MRNLKCVVALILTLSLTSCKQSANDNEDVSSKDQTKNSVVGEEQGERKIYQDNYGYKKPLCDYLTKFIVKSVFTLAIDFEYNQTGMPKPYCSLRFKVTNGDVGLILEGQIMGPKTNARKYLERQLERYEEHSKIDNLGDEAYVIDNKRFVRVIVMKEGLRYALDVTSQERDMLDKSVDLMREIMKNVP